MSEHEAWLSNATQKDIQLPLAGGGSCDATAEPPQTLLGQLPSRGEAPAVAKGLAVAHQSNFSCPGLLPSLSSSQASLRHRLEKLLSSISSPLHSLLRDFPAPWLVYSYSCGLWCEDEGSHSMTSICMQLGRMVSGPCIAQDPTGSTV